MVSYSLQFPQKPKGRKTAQESFFFFFSSSYIFSANQTLNNKNLKIQQWKTQEKTKETHGVKGTFQVLNSSIGKKDKEEGRAENMNVSSMVLQLLWGFTRRIIDNQWRFFVLGVHGLAILDPIDGRSAIKEENFLIGFQKWVAGSPSKELSKRIPKVGCRHPGPAGSRIKH